MFYVKTAQNVAASFIEFHIPNILIILIMISANIERKKLKFKNTQITL